METQDGIEVIDQHALHERVLYEQLRERMSTGAVEVQPLLIPEHVELSSSEFEAVTSHLDVLSEAGVKVEGVAVSKRLTDSPVVVVTSQFGYSAQQEKVMKAQAFQNKDQLSMMAGRKTLEVNPSHPVVVDLLAKVKANKDK